MGMRSSRGRAASTALLALVLGATACMPGHPQPVGGRGWSSYAIAEGAHRAVVHQRADASEPLAGFTRASRRRFHFAFTRSMRYRITDPVQPEDQLDWNKLPGLSDCGDLDLSRNGYMFAWRWRVDLDPKVMEIGAYVNHDGIHIVPPEPLLTLTAAEVDAVTPLWFDLRLMADAATYRFEVSSGPVGDDAVTHAVQMPRNCPGDPIRLTRWASGLYFGGTSTAPKPIRGFVSEWR